MRLWSAVSRQSLENLFRLGTSSRGLKAEPSGGGRGGEEEEEESMGTGPTELLGLYGPGAASLGYLRGLWQSFKLARRLVCVGHSFV